MSREDGENLVIVASKGGIDKHPAWYLNLKANPETAAWWHGRKRRVRARETEGASASGSGSAWSRSGPPTTTTSAAPSARSR